MVNALLLLAAILQALAVGYGVFLLSRRRGATGAWLFLLGAMLSMLAWRVVVVAGVTPPAFFNPLIAIWGSVCMVCAMFLFGREVTLRRQAEAQRDALLDSERAARTEAERASRLKDEFLATLSHELRTPLAAILGWCMVMRNGVTRREETERAIDVIERNARAQTRLVDDLLDVTRLQAGGLHLEFAIMPLDGAIRTAIQAVRPAADAKGVALSYSGETTSALVRGDAGRLQQVVTNLLVNAIKFTPPGGVITVTLALQGEQVQLVVADTGEGIDADFLPHVFARFRQADSTTARRHGGLGLGLSIVASLVQLHGGQVRASSQGKGRGATFTVTLPLAKSGESALDVPAAAAPAADPATRLAGIRVLLIDDEEDVRVSVARILEQMGANVVALSSSAGIEAVLSSYRPQIMLIDISMPSEDGYSLIRRIRRLPGSAGGATPAISLTAHARNEDRARALAAGFQQHLPKPVDVPALASAIAQLADGGASRAAISA